MSTEVRVGAVMSAPSVDRTTASMVWAITGKPRPGSAAHAFTPKGDGWRSECGRFLATEPTPATPGRKLCAQCDGLVHGSWRIQTIVPELMRKSAAAGRG